MEDPEAFEKRKEGDVSRGKYVAGRDGLTIIERGSELVLYRKHERYGTWACVGERGDNELLHRATRHLHNAPSPIEVIRGLCMAEAGTLPAMLGPDYAVGLKVRVGGSDQYRTCAEGGEAILKDGVLVLTKVGVRTVRFKDDPFHMFNDWKKFWKYDAVSPNNVFVLISQD